MRIRTFEKLNLKKFMLLSTPFTAISLYFTSWPMEWLAVLTVYVATVIYLIMFAEAVFEMTAPYQEEGFKADKRKISILLVGKLVILISALVFGVQIMGTRIIIPLLNYFIHILVLCVSLETTPKNELNK